MRLEPRVVRFLEGHPAVECVHYAGLESHPRHARARSLFAGFGGVLSFELEGPASRADEFAARVRLPIVAPSLGGVHTLDRKSTRLNSSHSQISYAVFCLKKKNKTTCTYYDCSRYSTHR